jgi:glutathione reductase (NADPH)
VAIAEEYRYGGTCVVRGCVPKKLFVYASSYGYAIADSVGFGWKSEQVRFDWPTLRDNVEAEITRLSGIYEHNLGHVGAELMTGRAVLGDAHTVEIGSKRVTAERILVATGGRPKPLGVPGDQLAINSNHMFKLPELPHHLTVVGGGYIGVEFAHIMAGLGVSVTLVHHRNKVLRGFDEDLRTAVTDGLADHGIDIAFEDEVAAIERVESGRLHVTLRSGDHLATDAVMSAIGRAPNTDDMGLKACDVALGADNEILVDEFSQTNIPSIYAVGDCTNRMALTPVAIREGQAFVDTIYGGTPTHVDYDNIPTAVFSQPPAATVGLSEEAASERYSRIDIYKTVFKPMVHTISGRNQRVMMKLVVDADSQRVLGVHMVGLDAAEIIQTVAIAIRAGASKADFDATVALHPTTAEELVLMKRKTTREHDETGNV